MKALNIIELQFLPCDIKPTEDTKLLFWEFGELKIGSFFDGRFYCRGIICFPDSWAYVPKEPNVK